MSTSNNYSAEFVLRSAAVLCVVMIKSTLAKKRKKKNVKRLWSRKWLQRRSQGKGTLHLLNNELKAEDPFSYRNFLRLTNQQFEYLLEMVAPYISKQDTVMRECIPARSKLEVTLRFIATGETFRSLMYSTRIHESTISKFIPEVCKAIVQTLQINYLKIPKTSEEWKKISDDFNYLWQFPHCLGALDGRHITFRAPISDGSYYYNYKGTNSIVLLGLVDANYKFIYVNIGVNGRISDGGVYHQSSFSQRVLNNTLNFPPPEPLQGQHSNTPYVIVADDAFPLSNNLMKPYPQRGLTHDCRIFNYRLSRARRIVENGFGILVNRCRVLLNPINLSAKKVELITLTSVLLHNYLISNNAPAYTEVREECLNKSLQNLPPIGLQHGNRSTNSAREVRDNFKLFFNSTGAVSWQEKSIGTYNY